MLFANYFKGNLDMTKNIAARLEHYSIVCNDDMKKKKTNNKDKNKKNNCKKTTWGPEITEKYP